MDEQTVPCKICDEPTIMVGTRLCDKCWCGLRHGAAMMESLGVDVMISYTGFTPFNWSVQLRPRDNTSCTDASGQSLEEALERAILSMKRVNR